MKNKNIQPNDDKTSKPTADQKAAALSAKKAQKAKIKAEAKLNVAKNRHRSKYFKKLQKSQKEAERQITLLQQKGDELNRTPKKFAKKPLTEEQIALKQAIYDIAEQQSPDAEWVNLDNAAMIFPSTDSVDINGMFRMSVVLKELVNPLLLQQALNNTVKRFPSIGSSIKRGLFWYYLEPSNFPVLVEEESLFPCTRIPMDSRHPCIRVTYYKYRVSIDFFHAVTDGFGGTAFLNTLLGAYFRLQGQRIEGGQLGYFDDRDKPKREELIDSFMQMADFKTPNVHKDVDSYMIPGTRLNNYSLLVTNGSISSAELNALAKSKGVTMGQYLTAVIIWAIEEDRRFFRYSKKRPVVISIPVNLRKLYPSPTLRNFIYVLTVKGNDTTDFDSILALTKEQFIQKNTLEYFTGIVNFNVKSQRNFFIKICPLFLKNIVLKIAFVKHSTRARTSTLSNLGVLRPPKEFADKIYRYEGVVGPQKRETVSFCSCSYNGNTVLTVSRTIKESNVTRLFFKKLSDDGLKIAIDTNCEV